jgi:hypothetical protein
MSPERLIVEAIKVAQDLLRQNLPPIHNLTDAATVLRLRELVHSPSIRSALDRSSDTLLAFALRAIERALCDHSQPHRETIELARPHHVHDDDDERCDAVLRLQRPPHGHRHRIASPLMARSSRPWFKGGSFSEPTLSSRACCLSLQPPRRCPNSERFCPNNPRGLK